VVHLLTNFTFYVNKINNHPIGAGVLLPNYDSNNPGLNNLTGGLVPAYVGQDTIYQRPRLQCRGDVGMPVTRQYQKRPGIESFYRKSKTPCDGLVSMTEDQILTAVLNDQLFGALEVDIKFPDNLKPTFAEMSPIFKNVDIVRDDIGDYMRQYAMDHEIMSLPRKSLIGSMFGSKIMIITPLLK
jgi:hypothetical protein